MVNNFVNASNDEREANNDEEGNDHVGNVKIFDHVQAKMIPMLTNEACVLRDIFDCAIIGAIGRGSSCLRMRELAVL